MKTPLYGLPFFQILPTLPQPLTSLLFLLPCFFGWNSMGWMSDRATFDVLHYLMVLYTCQTLVPERPCCVFYATRHQVYWGLTNNVVFLLVLWLDATHSHTKKDRQHTQGPRDWHTHIYIHIYIYIYIYKNKHRH